MTLMEQLEECGAMLIDGHDDALIGIGGAFNQRVAVYDKELIVKRLMKDGLTSEDAEEHFSYNIAGAYVGESTPILVEFCKGTQ